MAITSTGTVDIHYQQVGKGEDVILTHGLGSSLAFWFIRVLPAIARTHRVTVYDLRGHGHSSMPVSGYTSTQMASDLVRLMDSLHIQSAHLVGHSYGGLVSLEFATEAPSRVRSLTIADSRIPSLQPHVRLKDWPQWLRWRKELLALGVTVPSGDDDADFHLLEAIARADIRAVRPDEHRSLGPLLAWGRNRRTADRWLQLLRDTSARSDFRFAPGPRVEEIRSLNVPTLCLYGEFSHCLPSCQRLSNLLPDVRTVIIRRAGHFHPTLRPAAFLRHFRTFLLQQESQSASA
jgi:pimeloyl-ACP methyl ester carboxylesterase